MESRIRWRVGVLLWQLLFLGGAGAVCHTGSASECQSASPVPGTSLAGEGFDIVTLSAKGAYVVDVESWERPDGTCTLCTNSQMAGERQRLPLAVVDWRAQRSCSRTLSSQLFRSVSELAESINSSLDVSWRADLSLQPQPGQTVSVGLAGSKSKAMSFASHKAKSDRYSFTSHTFQCNLYGYRLKNPPPLSAQFSAHLGRITNTSYEGARHHYRRLVETFGTHYIQLVKLGGSFKDLTAIRTCKAAADGLTVEEVKDCLSVEASYEVIAAAKASAKASFCKGKASSLSHGSSFHQVFNERLTETSGGHSIGDTDTLFSSDPTVFTSWLKSLTESPGLIGYKLYPIHYLLPDDDHRRDQLMLYLSEYILANAQTPDCSKATCPAGKSKSASDPCSCLCPENNWTDRLCCAKQKGMGHLVVTVMRGFDLWGDRFTGTDGFVKVSYGRVKAQTSIVYNNNNPQWKARLDLGEVLVTSHLKFTLTVYDEDDLWNEALGTCVVPLTSGSKDRTCYLKYGKVTYNLSFTCGSHLQGPTCHQYAPSEGGPGFQGLLWANQSSSSEIPSLKVIFP
ncbi:perforin-1-like [Hypanus sabinus]|uniref:perforin-1-like n=1 Tax=Hypanus sabinus TaxID=79690 RepID=UPI0028C39B00|nr:perforin-1-like [Hypanus sabinus]